MFAHLTENSTDIEVYVTWVTDLETVLHCLITVVQVVILYLQSLLQEVKSTAQLLSTTENACEVVVGHCSESVCLLSQRLSLAQQLQSHVEVVYRLRLYHWGLTYLSVGTTLTEYCR